MNQSGARNLLENFIHNATSKEATHILKAATVRDVQFHSSSLFEIYQCRIHIQSGEEHLLAVKIVSDELMARTEATGLQALNDAGARVPFCYGFVTHANQSAIVMDFIQPGGQINAEDLIEMLNRLYHEEASNYGWRAGNYIGSLVQKNAIYNCFSGYWLQTRIQPQIEMACMLRHLDKTEGAQILQIVEKLILLWSLDAHPARLLHGDLWSGNVLAGPDGKSYLVDPSVAYGNVEQDLAMLCMFGQPLSLKELGQISEGCGYGPGLGERLAFWQIYPLLVHINLFGGSYVASLRKVLKFYT